MSRTTLRMGVFALPMLALMATGCSISRPEVRDTRVRVDGIDLRGVKLVCDVDVYNPYPFGLKTPEFDYGLEIAEVEFMSSKETTKIDLPSKEVGTITLPLRLEYLSIWKAHEGLVGAAEIPYRLHGSVVLVALGQSIRLPISHSGTIPICRVPTFSTPTVNKPELSLTRARVSLETDVTNPNVFGVGLKNMGITVTLGEVEVGRIEVAGAESLEPNVSKHLTITGEISGRTAIADLARGESLGKPKIRLTGSIDTPFGSVPID